MSASEVLSLIGILLGIIVLIIMMYNGLSSIFAAPIAAAVVFLFSGLPFLDQFLGVFYSGASKGVTTFGSIFLGSCVFGYAYQASGSPQIIANFFAKTLGAKRMIPALVISSLLLAYAGAGFATYMVLYSVGMCLCKINNYPTRILAACIFLGAWTLALTGPGAPTPSNIIPGQYFGTNNWAGLVPGLATGIVNIILGIIYLRWQLKKWVNNGETFSDPNGMLPEDSNIQDVSVGEFIFALLPIIVLLVSFNVFNLNLVFASCLAALAVVVLNFKKRSPMGWVQELANGAKMSIMPLMSLAMITAFGAVVNATPFYEYILENLGKLELNPYVLAVVVTNVLAGLLGSGASAVTLSMNSLGSFFLKYEGVYNMGNFHRLISLASGGLDSLPHNGNISSILEMFKTTHKESYFPIFICTCVLSILCTVCIGLPLMLLGF